MKTNTVVVKRAVLTDIRRIGTHVERWTEDRELADRTVDAIREFIATLGELPHHGTRRDDLRVGLRIVAFKKRTAIAFEVDDDTATVCVLRVFYGGEDYETLFRGR